MKTLFDNWSISDTGIITKPDLDRMLTRNTNIICVGDMQYWDEILLLRVSEIYSNTPFWIAIYNECKVSPSVLFLNKRDCLLICTDHRIEIIDLKKQKSIMYKEILGCFLFAKQISDRILIISEIGIYILNNRYQEILNQPTDLIERFNISNELLSYKTLSGTNELDITQYR